MTRTQKQDLEELLDNQTGFLARQWKMAIVKWQRAEAVIAKKVACIQQLQSDLKIARSVCDTQHKTLTEIRKQTELQSAKDATIIALEETIEVLRKELVVAGKPESETEDTETSEVKPRWISRTGEASYSVKKVGKVWWVWYNYLHGEGQSSNDPLNIDFPDEKSATIALDRYVSEYDGYKRCTEGTSDEQA